MPSPISPAVGIPVTSGGNSPKISIAPYVVVVLSLAAYLASVAVRQESLYFLVALGLVVLGLSAIKIELGLLTVPIILANPLRLESTDTNLILSEYVLLIVFGMSFFKACTIRRSYVFPKQFL